MKTLAILLLAATALVPASVAAQTVTPPERWQDVPPAKLKVPKAPVPAATPAPPAPPAGVTWQRPAPKPYTAQAPAHAAHAPAAPAPAHAAHKPLPPGHPASKPAMAPPPGHHAPPAGHVRDHAGMSGHHRPAMEHSRDRAAGHHARAEHRRSDRRNGYADYRRVERGHRVPAYWWGPRYHVQNWGLYGFHQPVEDRRWVRYYDDALLIDRNGAVHDGRWDMDWDAHGESWDHDQRGIPAYDDDDYGDDDYGYDEEHADGSYADEGPHDMYGEEGGGYHHGGGYAYPGYGYGWGYGWGGVTITETTVTTAPTVTEHIIYEDARPARRHKSRSRRHHAEPSCDCPAAPYPMGEKG